MIRVEHCLGIGFQGNVLEEHMVQIETNNPSRQNFQNKYYLFQINTLLF